MLAIAEYGLLNQPPNEEWSILNNINENRNDGGSVCYKLRWCGSVCHNSWLIMHYINGNRDDSGSVCYKAHYMVPFVIIHGAFCITSTRAIMSVAIQPLLLRSNTTHWGYVISLPLNCFTTMHMPCQCQVTH